MFGINGKTLVCLLIVLIITLLAGFGGLVIGSNAHNLFPSSWLSFLPTIGTENTLFLDLNEKPIANAYLSIEGNVKNISATEITIEDAGKSKTFKLGADLRPYKMQSQGVAKIPPVLPETIAIKDIKIGNHVIVTVTVIKGELVVTSLMVVLN